MTDPYLDSVYQEVRDNVCRGAKVIMADLIGSEDANGQRVTVATCSECGFRCETHPRHKYTLDNQ